MQEMILIIYFLLRIARRPRQSPAVRRGLAKIDETAGMDWLQAHLDYCVSPLLQEPWVLDVDTTIKPLYGTQEGAVVGYNPRKPGRPSHCYHTYMMSTLRLVLSVDVRSDAIASPTGSYPTHSRPRTLSGPCAQIRTALRPCESAECVRALPAGAKCR